jgi:mannose-6-phosphate isomerase-like protein (cupin superfamily)
MAQKDGKYPLRNFWINWADKLGKEHYSSLEVDDVLHSPPGSAHLLLNPGKARLEVMTHIHIIE